MKTDQEIYDELIEKQAKLFPGDITNKLMKQARQSEREEIKKEMENKVCMDCFLDHMERIKKDKLTEEKETPKNR